MGKLDLANKKGKTLAKGRNNTKEEGHQEETKRAMGCLDVYFQIHEKPSIEMVHQYQEAK